MLRHILLILVSNLFVFCSSETDNMISASIASKFGDEDEEGEEEITAVPPTVISGAHLVCLPKFKDENSQTIRRIARLSAEEKIPSLRKADLV
ncbi:MAG: hypothetical protein AB8G05_10450 [Oligoflexales bacterium]